MTDAPLAAPTFAHYLTAGAPPLDETLRARLHRGEAILETPAEVDAYRSGYGRKHRARVGSLLHWAVEHLPVFRGAFQTVDWGCGTLLATYLLRDALAAAGLAGGHVASVGLDASAANVERAGALWTRFGARNHQPQLFTARIEDGLEDALSAVIPGVPVVHLASNFLDVSTLDVADLGRRARPFLGAGDRFLAVSPYQRPRLDAFRRAAGLGPDLLGGSSRAFLRVNMTAAAFVAQAA